MRHSLLLVGVSFFVLFLGLGVIWCEYSHRKGAEKWAILGGV